MEHIEALSERLSSYSAIKVLPQRCMRMRNTHSICKLCQTICKHTALHVSCDRLEIDPQQCTSCGACAAVCPSNALAITNPTLAELINDAKSKAEHLNGAACFVCEKHARENKINASLVTVLPCLDYLDEYALCGLITHGITHIAVLKPNCIQCEINGDVPYFETVLASTKNLLTKWHIPGRMQMFSEIPAALINENKSACTQSYNSRRQVFHQTKDSVTLTIKEGVKSALKYLGSSTSTQAQSQARTGTTSTHYEKPPEASYRGVRLLRELNNVGYLEKGDTIESRFWVDVSIDTARCSFCGDCAAACPTQALSMKQTGSAGDKQTSTVSCTSSLCIGCGLCHDICSKHAIVLSHRIPAQKLMPLTKRGM